MRNTTAMQTRTAVIGIVAGIILGATATAGAATVVNGPGTPPPNPQWMAKPCATPESFQLSNCYWDPAQMGDGTGPAAYFVRTMPGQGLRCYFYSSSGTDADHCVGAGVKERYRARR